MIHIRNSLSGILSSCGKTSYLLDSAIITAPNAHEIAPNSEGKTTMPYQHSHLMKLKPNQLHNNLAKRNLPTETREEIKATITAQKATQKSMRAKTTKVNAEWRPLLAGLRMERESLRSSLSYKAGQRDPKLITALEGYSIVLDRLHGEFEMHKRELRTPAVIARERNLPNGGIHWTDWIKEKFKERVRLLFDAVDYPVGTKTKQPFPRKTDPKSAAKLKARLHTRTLKEHGIAEQDHQLNPNERTKAKLNKLTEALRRIDQLQPTDPVPRTYSGLFVMENGADCPEK